MIMVKHSEMKGWFSVTNPAIKSSASEVKILG